MFITKEVDGKTGLYATRVISRGANIAVLTFDISEVRTATSIQIGVDLHSEHPWARYINHSFEPNCAIDGQEVLTIKRVESGDELTFDYTSNEDDISAPFVDAVTGKWVGSKYRNLPEVGFISLFEGTDYTSEEE